MNELLGQGGAGADGWVAEIGHAGWTIHVAPSRGVDGPPYNMRVIDPAGVEKKVCFFVETVEEAVRKAASTMAISGAHVDRWELTTIARAMDKKPEAP